jgi:predicted amidohydrolase
MRQARQAGARIIHFPEGATCSHIYNQPESIAIAVTKARPWRREARAGIYEVHRVTDARSDDRGAF